MTIRQQGGIFGRNPTFNNVSVDGDLTGTKALLQTGAYSQTANSNADELVIKFSDKGGISFLGPEALIFFGDANDNNPGRIAYVHSTDSLSFTTADSLAATFTSSGNLAFPSGQGIDFSATSGTGTSELFDDYEEGTWTPTYVPQTNSFTSITYDPNTAGKYTKVGNTVYIAGSLRTDAITVGTATGSVSIGGLPFSVGSSNYASGGITVYQSNLFTGEEPSSADFVANGTTATLLYRTAADGPLASEAAVADLGTGANSNILRFFGFYFV